jgi:hypothetical protein
MDWQMVSPIPIPFSLVRIRLVMQPHIGIGRSHNDTVESCCDWRPESASMLGRSIIGRSGSVDADQTAWNAWLIKAVSMVVGK